MAEGFDFSISRRQPVQAVVQALIKAIVSIIKMIWPFALAYIFSSRRQNSEKGDVILIISLVFIVLTILYNLFEFFYLRYILSQNELVIKTGFLIKKEVVLPLEKIQAVHLDRDWLQRLMGIAKVSFDTPGTAKMEERIFLNYQVALALRDTVLGLRVPRPVTEGSPEREMPVISLSATDLLKLGISANFIKALIILTGFGFSRLDDLQSITGKSSWDWVNWVDEKASAGSALLIISGITTVILFSIFISFGLVILKYANFSLTQSNRGFHIKSGLINLREKLVPFNKIQFITWEANWIRRHIPYYLFHYHIIGDHEISDKWRIAVPATRKSFFPVLLQHYHPELPASTPSLTMSKAYILRQAMYALLLLLPVIIISIFSGWEQGWRLAFIFPVWILVAELHRRNFRAAVSPGAVQVNHSVFGKSHTLLRWDKVVSVTVKQSIFQRRRSLATVVLYTGGGRVLLPYLSLEEANQVRDYALYKSEVAAKQKI